MSSIGGEIGGKIGNTQNPAFTSTGGITPQQQALADYGYGQNLLEDVAQFETPSQPGGGAAMSTMATQAAGGANTGRALAEAGMSDVNQNAAYDAYKVGIATQQQNQANALSNITQLDKLAGSVAGAIAPTGSG